MDVTCERCSTEYEFDETLVSERGTTVKCTNCGHLFKVHRGAARGNEGAGWSVRRHSGGVLRLSSLRELQTLITDGQLTEEDQISRGGSQWKALGAIAELQSFFTTAKKQQHAGATVREGTQPFPTSLRAPRSEAAPPSQRPVAPYPAEFEPTQSKSLKPSRLQVPRTAKRTVVGLGPTTNAAPPQMGGDSAAAASEQGMHASPTVPAPAHTPAAAGQYTDLFAASTVVAPRSEPPAEAFRTQTPQHTSPADLDAHAERLVSEHSHGATFAPTDAPTSPVPGSPLWSKPVGSPPTGPERALEQPRKPRPDARSRSRVGGGSAPSRRSGSKSRRPAPVGRALYLDDDERDGITGRRGGRAGLWIGVAVVAALVGGGIAFAWPALAPAFGLTQPAPPTEDLSAIEDALTRGDEAALTQVLESFASNDAGASVERQVALSRVEAALAQLLLFRSMDLDAVRDGSGADARRSADAHTQDAIRLAERASDAAAGDASTLLALANALRLDGKTREARDALERAAGADSGDTGDFHYVSALLEMTESGDTASAREGAQRAVEHDPEPAAPQLLLVRALLSAGDVAGARAHIGAVRDRYEGHAEAAALDEAIDAGRPPAAPIVAGSGETAEEPASPPPTAVADAPPEPDERRRPTKTKVARRSRPPARDRAASSSRAATNCRDADCWTQLGSAAHSRGDVGRARTYFERAHGLEPFDPEVNAGLGAVYFDLGNPNVAIGHLEVAARANYSDSAIILGRAYLSVGLRSEARRVYQDYLDRNPGGRYAEAARRGLQAAAPTSTPAPAAVPTESSPTEVPSTPEPPPAEGSEAPSGAAAEGERGPTPNQPASDVPSPVGQDGPTAEPPGLGQAEPAPEAGEPSPP